MKLSFGGGNKVSARMLENFTRLLSSLLAAGVPLSRALVILCKEASSPAAAAKWKQVYDLVIDGMSLADAMAKSPENFPARLCGDGRGGRDGRISRRGAGADRRLSGARKGDALQGDDRAALPDHPAGARAGRAGVPARLLHPALSTHFRRLRGIIASAHPAHRFDQSTHAFLRAVSPGGPRNYRLSNSELAGFGKRPARLGRADSSARRSSGRWSRNSPCRGSAGCWARCWAPACR